MATLVAEKQAAGNYTVERNAKRFSSGLYFYLLKAEEFVQTKKLILRH